MRHALITVTAWLLSLAACGAGLPDAGQVAARIDRLLSEAYPSAEPGAAVLVSRAGAVILERGYGLADTARAEPVTPATRFRLASVTKAFTGTAILALAERGDLALDDPVTKFLPAFPSSGRTITLRHLLSHTAGLADYLDRPDSMAWAAREHTVEELVGEIGSRPPSFGPGQKIAYCNSNYVLLGAIVEKITGRTFAQFVEASLFAPLGMKSTFCAGTLEGVPALATAYEPARTSDDELDWSRMLVARPYTLSSVYAAGGCVSSIEDLSRFHDALLKGALIGRRSLARSFEPAAPADGRAGAMSEGGWQLDRIDGHVVAMRGGALPGVCAWFLTMPDDEVAVILLSNRTPGKPRCGMLAVEIARIVVGG
jgi:CubicO group peptidase (beta-lactamase class C family)